MHIVLLEPEIPQNTGNIARTCAATGAKLHLIEPLGFSIEDKYVKRAGLDYWELLDLRVYTDFSDFLRANPGALLFPASTKAPRDYASIAYPEDAYLLFGKETKGLPESIIEENMARAVRIPMLPGLRSLNLSNSVAVVLYEALRQHGFLGMQSEGKLTGFVSAWKDHI